MTSRSGTAWFVSAATAVLIAATAADAGEKIVIGTVNLPATGPLYIAQDKGYFAAQDLDVEVRFFESAQAIATAVVSGDIQFGATSLTAGFWSLADKGGLKVIAGMLADRKDYHAGNAFVVSNDAYAAGVTTPAKLGGKVFAVTTIGSSLHYGALRVAETLGVDPATIQIRPMQQWSAALAAVKTGKVDATQAAAATARGMEAAGEVKIIGWQGDYIPFQIAAIFTSAALIKKDRGLVERFIKGYAKGIDFYTEAFLKGIESGAPQYGPETDEAIAIIHKRLLKDDPDFANKIKASVTYYHPKGAMDVDNILSQVAFFKANDLVAKSIDPGKLIDGSFVPPLPQQPSQRNPG
ncbi:ABC transporter substrate-binding protein [Chelatococcus asaccharovorans]|uniref:NitT/TauT family transport system substrate-binding protein n=1 Tax=Chelatococcus asaccharovorans TaxID=28210 RepID=A0A2V3UDK3_9HYPH|nr:ABC transporter substrate-binding protein [Chelatococcus asaccharovorans]MBS7703246.1 ABC transporter substrate-binding protein [Chelatococcus asaccharovorans]PXW61576.1 NitT/TauT family transport system substrate-binding protein [Chelatococcus asaccharovorans]